MSNNPPEIPIEDGGVNYPLYKRQLKAWLDQIREARKEARRFRDYPLKESISGRPHHMELIESGQQVGQDGSAYPLRRGKPVKKISR